MSDKQRKSTTQDFALLERIPNNVLLDPIDYIFADHCRQAEMCAALKEIAANELSKSTSPKTASAILHCLNVDLPNHIQDEEHDLFPCLKARAIPSDRFSDVLSLVDREHVRDRDLAERVRQGLQHIVDEMPLEDPNGFRNAAEMLAEIHLSHLNWENAVILPLARKRLVATDLETIGRAMATRRNIPYPACD